MKTIEKRVERNKKKANNNKSREALRVRREKGRIKENDAMENLLNEAKQIILN